MKSSEPDINISASHTLFVVQTKTIFFGTNYRGKCSCGWSSQLCSTEKLALLSIDAHFNGIYAYSTVQNAIDNPKNQELQNRRLQFEVKQLNQALRDNTSRLNSILSAWTTDTKKLRDQVSRLELTIRQMSKEHHEIRREAVRAFAKSRNINLDGDAASAKLHAGGNTTGSDECSGEGPAAGYGEVK